MQVSGDIDLTDKMHYGPVTISRGIALDTTGRQIFVPKEPYPGVREAFHLRLDRESTYEVASTSSHPSVHVVALEGSVIISPRDGGEVFLNGGYARSGPQNAPNFLLGSPVPSVSASQAWVAVPGKDFRYSIDHEVVLPIAPNFADLIQNPISTQVLGTRAEVNGTLVTSLTDFAGNPGRLDSFLFSVFVGVDIGGVAFPAEFIVGVGPGGVILWELYLFGLIPTGTHAITDLLFANPGNDPFIFFNLAFALALIDRAQREGLLNPDDRVVLGVDEQPIVIGLQGARVPADISLKYRSNVNVAPRKGIRSVDVGDKVRSTFTFTSGPQN